MIVVVGIPTYRRPDNLGRLLALLPAQRDQVLSRMPQVTVTQLSAVVVDNDPAGSALAAMTDQPPWMTYLHEPNPGISAVRNRIMDACTSADLLAFIDDDEVPADEWLLSLLHTWRETGAAAVAGRVVPRYLSSPGPWLLAGEFFVRRNLPSGTPLDVAPCGNLLLDMNQIRPLRIRFDDHFGLSGGEDTLFSRQLAKAGGRIVFCRESEAVDEVPAHRLTRRWVLERSLSHGNTTGVVDIATCSDRDVTRVRTRVLVGGTGRVLAGTARALIGVALRQPRHEAKGLRLLMRGLGMVLAGSGYTYQEYSRTGTRLARTVPKKRKAAS